MAGRNVNKIKPWMLAKNTNEIVSSYVQNMYKQMPMSFNKGLKNCKVATFRPENRGPLSTWKNEQKQLPTKSITPRMAVTKKSSSKIKQHTNNVMNFFRSNKNNQQFSTHSPSNSLTSGKRVLKTPNYKIYKTLRYGSSCSSSRSTIFKRYDERKRQRQSNVAQINYLIRSFHTSKFEPTYARFLMPARNQQLETTLGSIPAAIKFSNNMLKDLMKVDRSTKGKIAQQQKEKNIANMTTTSSKRYSLEKWNHPPSLSKYKIRSPKEGALKNVKSLTARNMSKAKLTPENRDYARLNLGRGTPLRHAKPANELFTPQHDRRNTELHEKHRRNRMKKLGLIESSSASEKSIALRVKSLSKTFKTTARPNAEPKPQKSKGLVINKKLPRLGNQTESKIMPPLLIENNKVLDETSDNNALRIQKETFISAAEEMPLTVSPTNTTLKTIENSRIPLANKTNATKAAPGKYGSFVSSATLPISYSTISPIVALRAQMPNKTDLGTYRYHRHDFFSTKKY